MNSIRYVLLPFSLLLCACNVDKEYTDNFRIGNGESEVEITAISSYHTKSLYDDNGVFSWSSGDTIALFAEGDYSKLDLISGSGSSEAVFKGTVPDGKTISYAVYPYRKENGDHSVFLPEVYKDYIPSCSSLPMYAEYNEGSNLYFEMTTGALRVVLSNIPAGISSITVATDRPISGNSVIDVPAGGTPCLLEPDGRQFVEIDLNEKTEESGSITIDVPVPAGLYHAYAVDLHDQEGALVNSIDFMKDLEMAVGHIQPVNIDCKTSTVVYTLPVTGIPTLFLETNNHADIVSKEEYLPAQVSVRNEDGSFQVLGVGKVKGRGNSTWGNEYGLKPKRPYKIKFDSKQSLLGEPKDKEWVLLASYGEKTFLRNPLAFELGYMSNLDYTPAYHHVELVLNGKHIGNYILVEQLKISKNRVNVGDNGFLLEIDAKASDTDVTFTINTIGQPINIKDPDVVVGDDNYQYVQSFFTLAENALYGENYTDPEEGYAKYLDVDSFIDWYLINELGKNGDAVFWTSCYMNLPRDGKIKMGPLWDFDRAFGNINYADCFKTDGFYVSQASWYSRLFTDPSFVAKLKERMSFFYSKKTEILSMIDDISEKLSVSARANEDVWHDMNTLIYPNYKVCGSYSAEVKYLKDWFSERLEWLNTNIAAL